jgi:geranylgeranyl diphosphate synthase type II
MIEEALQKLVPELKSPWICLYQAARYSLLNGGKRVRPRLTLAATQALGGSLELALASACAIECLHTYSLIHDDLPAMDDDDFRRGKPSLHKAFGEAHAILAGDFLLTRAFGILSEAEGLTAQQKIALIQILATQGGDLGMIGGQILDIEGNKHPIELIHQMKTGALISAACEFGAVIANHPARKQMRAFGEKIGLAFQFIDDLLDADKNEPVSSIHQLGIEGVKREVQRLQEEASAILLSIDGCDPAPLQALSLELAARSY